MTLTHILFYFFGVLALFPAFMVIAAKNAVRAVLFLVLTFFATAVLWLLLTAEFLSLILVLVYVGAVMTLFLFVVMMLDLRAVSLDEGWVRYWPIGALLILGLVLLMGLGIWHGGLHLTYFNQLGLPGTPASLLAEKSNIVALGEVLYTTYVWPFEIAAVLLLTAIVAAIALAHREPTNRKRQNISKQIDVSPATRIRLVHMPSEKKGRNA